MCGRITLLTFEELRDVASAVELGDGNQLPLIGLEDDALCQRAQARPGGVVQALAAGTGKPGGPSSPPATERGYQAAKCDSPALGILDLTWGFPIDGGKKTAFNTRIESALAGSRMWAAPLRDGRCILPVASFFEPHATETSTSPRTGKPIKRQYEFCDEDGMPLLLASVHDGERLSVVTTEPNEIMAPIHPRMPLVLRFEEVGAWLYGEYASLADRADIVLAAQPETPAAPPTAQLSLFT